MRVGAVVLHYRFWPDVNETLDALARQHHPLARVVVVDNRSGDGSAEKLRDRDGIDLVEAASNDGYAAGMNLGVKALQRDHVDAVLLLTHEAVLSPEGLGVMVDELAAHPELGAVGPLLAWHDDPERVYSAGVYLNPRTWSTHHIGAGDLVQAWSGRRPQPVDSLDGAAALVRRTAMESIGPINESYFLYFEEADYFVRMRRDGWKLACVPGALALQRPGLPPRALWVRNTLCFLADNAPKRVLARELLRIVYYTLLDKAHGRNAGARERVAGLSAFLFGRPARSLVGRG